MDLSGWFGWWYLGAWMDVVLKFHWIALPKGSQV
jgi:hypothetical protein